jgi:hypothetical protein
MENYQNSLYVPRWLLVLEMVCFRAGVYTWVGMGFFLLPRVKKYIKQNYKSFLIWGRGEGG